MTALNDLLTVDCRDPREVYGRILEEVGARLGDGLGLFFRIAQVGDALYYDDFSLQNTRDQELPLFDEIAARPILSGPKWQVNRCRPEHISSFVQFDIEENFKKSAVYKHFIRPFGIHSVVRINVYDGARFVGQVGSYHRDDESQCTAQSLALVRELTAPICAALTAADKLRDGLVPQEGAFVVFTANGRVEFVSCDADLLLTANRRERLRQAVRRLDQGDVDHCIQLVDGLEARLTRMEGAGHSCYLATLAPATVPTLDPLSVLTSAQRQIAEHAITGATIEDIARHVCRSPHTVRTHLKNIYTRLSISSRLELAALLQSSRDSQPPVL